MKQNPSLNTGKESLDKYLFDHKSHPATKIVKHTGEVCCPFNGPVDQRGSPVGPNTHYEEAYEEMKRQLYRKIDKE